MACPPKKEKYTNYNVLIIHNLWGLPNLPIGSQQSDPKKGKTYLFQCSKNTQFMGTSKFTHGAHIACPPKKEKFTHWGPSRVTKKKEKYTNSNVLRIHNLWGPPNLPIGPEQSDPKKGKIYKFQCSKNTQFMGTSKFTHGEHIACPPKKEKYTNYNVLIIHNLWGLPNLPIGP